MYIIESTIYISVFTLFMMIMMKRTTFFRMNRILLVCGTAVCTILPLVDLNVPKASIELDPTYVIGMVLQPLMENGESSQEGMNYGNILKIIYLAGTAMTVTMTAVSYYRMAKVIRSFPISRNGHLKLRISEDEIPSFSWGRNIVISRRNLEENPAILRHEQMHAECGHTIDLAVYSIFTAVHWFNPIVWMARNELKMLHEYEADELITKDGYDIAEYQSLILQTAVGTESFQQANGFSYHSLKRRIRMMGNRKSKGWMRAVYLTCIPLVTGAMLCSADIYAADRPEEPVPFTLLDTQPMFQGEDAQSFSRWVNQRLIYPESAKHDRVTGRVTVSFTVSKTGKITDIKVRNGAHPDLDKEAVRVVSMAPDWTPGIAGGRPVPTTFTFPIIFNLR